MQTYCPWCMTPTAPGAPCPHCGKLGYTPSRHQLPPDSCLQRRYVTGRVLGSGGFTITYLGRDTRQDRRVVIREYFPHAFAQRDADVSPAVNSLTQPGQREAYEKGLSSFCQEGQALSQFDHTPELVQVLDRFRENNTAYMIMEYLEGQPLSELIRQKTMTMSEALERLEPVFRAVEAIHRKGLLHRDISPDNIMCMADGSVKLMNFAAVWDSVSSHTMRVMLKQGYAPIEQYMGHKQGPWTDVYALCATIYDCVTGQPPAQAVTRDGSADPLEPPSQLGAVLSSEQEQALLKGLAVQPQNRWQSVSELWDAFHAADSVRSDAVDLSDLSDIGNPTPLAETAPEGPEQLEKPSGTFAHTRSPHGNRPFLILLLLAFLLLAVGAFLFLSGSEGSGPAAASSIETQTSDGGSALSDKMSAVDIIPENRRVSGIESVWSGSDSAKNMMIYGIDNQQRRAGRADRTRTNLTAGSDAAA